jgi:hypothetical protein
LSGSWNSSAVSCAAAFLADLLSSTLAFLPDSNFASFFPYIHLPSSPLHHSLKASEFRYWLKSERGKYLDELTSEEAHKYFRRFVRRWNDGALPRQCYDQHESTAARASENTN